MFVLGIQGGSALQWHSCLISVFCATKEGELIYFMAAATSLGTSFHYSAVTVQLKAQSSDLNLLRETQ